MSNSKTRLERLERALKPQDPGECQCTTRAGVSGWRRIIKGYVWPMPGASKSDTVEVCQLCGKVRPSIEIVYCEDWRPADPGVQDVRLQWPDGIADNEH